MDIPGKIFADEKSIFQDLLGKHVGKFHEALEILGNSGNTTQLWQLWNDSTLTSFCLALQDYAAGFKDKFEAPEVDKYRNYGRPCFTRVPLYDFHVKNDDTKLSKQCQHGLYFI